MISIQAVPALHVSQLFAEGKLPSVPLDVVDAARDPAHRDMRIEELAALLRPFFLSSSLGTAPLAQGTSGGRTTVLTTASTYTRSVNGFSGAVLIPQPFLLQAAFVAGSYTFSYAAAAFKVAPIVIVLPIGAPPSAGTSWYLNAAPSATTAVVKSTDATDTRAIELAAFPNPN